MLSLKDFTPATFQRNVLGLSVGLFSPLLFAKSAIDLPLDLSTDADEVSIRLKTELVDGKEIPVYEVDGVTRTLDGVLNAGNFRVINGGELNLVNGASIDWVEIQNSTLNVNRSLVRDGISVHSGEVFIEDSTVSNVDGIGVRLYLTGTDLVSPSVVTLKNSTVTGIGFGGAVGTTGEIRLANSSITGTGTLSDQDGNAGLKLAGGTARITEGSHVAGSESGIRIINGTHGLSEQLNRVHIDGSTVSATVGSAIKVTKSSIFETETTVGQIVITDNSVLQAGNGRLVDVDQESTANVKVINSTLSGDFVADDTSTLNVVLRNHAQLNGNIVNGNSVAIDSSGRWQLAADNSVNSLAMDGGSVGFTGDGFHSLSLGELSGSGLFDMRINLDDGTGDLLSVNGEASGRHRLHIQNTGIEAVPAEFDPLQVVHTEGGDAEFGLVGGRADLGVYSYELERQGTDWFIVGSGKEISPSTKSALALFNTAPTVWNSELTTLRSRMGEVRGQEQGGGWMRTYGSRFNAALDSGVDYSQKQQGLSFGADAPVPVGNGQLLLGLMGGYSKSDLDIGRGTSGQVDSYYMGAYGTWLSEGGYYLDGVLKLNQFHNESKVAMSDGTKAKGDYSSKALGGSLEVGKHIKLGDEYFVEPFAQVSSVWIDGSSYTLDNGMQARTNQTQSVLGKVGSTVGRSFALKDGGVVKPYARVAWAHEFSRSNDVSVNGQRFDNDLFGSRAELGAGLSVSLSERFQVHADFDYMKGEHVEQPWGANVGVRLAF
ncbi:autotransporter outer membrane beta-barrel domain-containing protein [Pseudomonas sp. W2-17]|uniref:autotransporter outer membrane beta-barrel domain-containing protein n=1 Tax=Pseudomonas sp. W2-17 TaxID=3058039 RepID=UPI0034E0A3E9